MKLILKDTVTFRKLGTLSKIAAYSAVTLFSAAMMLSPEQAQAQEGNYTVALFTPSLDFRDGVSRSDFAQKVASKLSEVTGKTWKGQAFARSGDFDSALSRGDVSVVIVDADYYMSKLQQLKPVGELIGPAGPSSHMVLVAKNGGSANLYDYRGKTLAMPISSSMAKKFISATALDGEISVSDYFKIDEVRDMRSALNALNLGKADIVMTLDGYNSGFTSVYKGPSYPLPVIALTDKLDADTRSKVSSAVKSLDVSGASLIVGSRGYSTSTLNSFRASLQPSKRTLNYRMLDQDTSTNANIRGDRISPKSPTVDFQTNFVSFAPSLVSFDRKLDLEI